MIALAASVTASQFGVVRSTLAGWFRVSALGVLAACATNPVTGDSQLVLIDEASEIRMGRDLDLDFVATGRVYHDSSWQQYVQQVGVRLAAKSERPSLPWTFRVLDDSRADAFAAPGGFVYVTRGMLTYLNSEDQLAALLSHEIGHVAARHVVVALSRARAMRVLNVAVAAIPFPVGGATPSWTPLAGAYASDLLRQVLQLKFSRDQQEQADVLGVRYLSQVGYDAGQLEAVLRVLGGGTSDGGTSTDPSLERRADRLSAYAPPAPRTSADLARRDAFLRRLEGLVVGRDRRRGYFDGSRFVVPERRVEVTFPAGWTPKMSNGDASAASPDGSASIELTRADEAGADSAARAFFARRAIAEGSPTRDSTNGLFRVVAPFTSLPGWDKIRGSVAFIEYGGTVYRLMGYAKRTQWPAYREVADSALRTFRAASDSEVLCGQPLRLTTLVLDRPTSLATLAHEHRAPEHTWWLAQINQVGPDSVLPAGQALKWIVGVPYRN